MYLSFYPFIFLSLYLSIPINKCSNQALNKYNTQLTENAKMREVIDHLKQERDSFDGIYKKLERELTDVKKQMADVIEKSNQVRRSSQEAQLEMLCLGVNITLFSMSVLVNEAKICWFQINSHRES